MEKLQEQGPCFKSLYWLQLYITSLSETRKGEATEISEMQVIPGSLRVVKFCAHGKELSKGLSDVVGVTLCWGETREN